VIDIAYKIHIVSEHLITRLYVKIIQYISCFTNRIWKTKILAKLINKLVLIREPVLKDTLIFLVKAYLKLVLGNSQKINYCKVYLWNVYIELYRIFMEVQIALEWEIIKLVRLSITKDIRNMCFSFSKISCWVGGLIIILVI